MREVRSEIKSLWLFDDPVSIQDCKTSNELRIYSELEVIEKEAVVAFFTKGLLLRYSSGGTKEKHEKL